MAIAQYSDLKSAIAAWTVRTDLTAYLDDFIDLAEAMLRFEPQPPESPKLGGVRIAITTTTGTLTASQDYIDKPSDLLQPLSLDLTGTNGARLRYLGNDAMPMAYRTGTGQPKYWTVTDAIDFDISPDSAYAYELKYYSDVAALSDANTTNAVITNHPDVYLAACLYYAFDFIQDNEQANKWLARYKAYAWAASRKFRAQNIPSGGLSAAVA